MKMMKMKNEERYRRDDTIPILLLSTILPLLRGVN